MIIFNNKEAKEHCLGILVSLVNVHNLKLKKLNPKQTQDTKKPRKRRILIFMCNSYTKF